MVGDSGPEKRKFPRIMVRVLVDFESNNTFFYDYTNNLSEGGIFIETENPLPMGSPLTVRFTLPGIDRVFEAVGSVAWVYSPKPGDSGPPSQVLGKGMGIHFESLDQKELDLIRDYIKAAIVP